MNQPPATDGRVPERSLWALVAGLILVGIALYFWFAPTSPPAAPPVAEAE